MAQISTYRQIVGIFEYIASKHLQINDFVVGRNWEVKDQINFPFLQVRPSTAQVIKNVNGAGFNTLEISLFLRVLEQLNKEEKNKTDAISDTLQILSDVITLVNTHPYFADKTIQIINDPEFIEEEELTTLNAVGWACLIRLRIINYAGACGIPVATMSTTDFYADYQDLNSTKPWPYDNDGLPYDGIGEPIPIDPDIKP
jgi:hypothetical protein